MGIAAADQLLGPLKAQGRNGAVASDLAGRPFVRDAGIGVGQVPGLIACLFIFHPKVRCAAVQVGRTDRDQSDFSDLVPARYLLCIQVNIGRLRVSADADLNVPRSFVGDQLQ